ncbi:Chemotaxis protein CheA [Candidatus Bealeia paramacronuclearis]|uniref:Chemotaxis protein CheA n=1 Tax=Candidatus Bealeia paramacronuclearis TaxID=1921001 RepID=A0ABZ2C4P1_9PROT|nr:Chemotaxis protein CheA [Candidatus Bealeia paramacronuclearis]
MDELLEEFITEACENLEKLDNDLVILEKDPNDVQLLGNIFRTIHTIKGACGFIGLARLEKIAHSGENVLGKFRDGEMKVTPEAITLILACVDAIKFILQTLKDTGQEPEGEDSALIQKLQDLITLGSTSKEETIIVPQEEIIIEDVPENVEIEDVTPLKIEVPEVMAPSFEASEPVHTVPTAEHQKSAEKDQGPQSIRVNVSLLENLITTVGELVLTRNQLLQLVRQSESSTFEVPLQRLNQVTSELQESVMKTRMQPIGNAWSQMPRLVRDLAKDLNKKIELEMLGADTEIDRQVIELIKDPLTHMLRNSADHGLETPEERIQSGKSAMGTIRLNAYQAGGHIVIEISDNGRGLNLERIKEKAIQNRLASLEEIANKSDAHVGAI